ncbi:hypothetical protein [Roseobacter sp.]|uniref:hypothetical protein n=1 Tax=Roseobacter sp. TaxID=1907202 RepID=UPI0032996303
MSRGTIGAPPILPFSQQDANGDVSGFIVDFAQEIGTTVFAKDADDLVAALLDE